ncbi:MAG: hypothetical protein WCS56_00095 [Bacilli bacterium]
MKVAEQLPRICKDGSIRWYHGDTFILTLSFHLKDSCEIEIIPTVTDKIEVFVKDYKNEVMATFSVLGSTDIDINITEDVSNRLIEGVYTLNARFNGTFITTLINNNKVVVE